MATKMIYKTEKSKRKTIAYYCDFCKEKFSKYQPIKFLDDYGIRRAVIELQKYDICKSCLLNAMFPINKGDFQILEKLYEDDKFIYPDFLYFAQSKIHKYIKIGRSKIPSLRIKNISNNFYDKLELLFAAPMLGEYEKKIHTFFDEYNLNKKYKDINSSEWFFPDTDILDYIGKNKYIYREIKNYIEEYTNKKEYFISTILNFSISNAFYDIASDKKNHKKLTDNLFILIWENRHFSENIFEFLKDRMPSYKINSIYKNIIDKILYQKLAMPEQ